MKLESLSKKSATYNYNNLCAALNRTKRTNKKLNGLIRQKNVQLFQLRQVIHELNNSILDLQTNPPISPLQIWNILESILDHDKSFHFPQPIPMRVQNLNDDEHKSIDKEINPRDVICITSLGENDEIKRLGNQRRRKLIFYREESAKYGVLYKTFMINSDKNFIELCDEIDKLSWYLCPVKKDTIVNVRFYDINKELLTLNEECYEKGIKKTVTISKDLSFKDMNAIDAFAKIKTYYDNRVLFQKKAICYKEEMGL
jgi:hypothetical protein